MANSTPLIIPYYPRKLQTRLHQKIQKRNVWVTHRRFGKTVCAINQLIKSCLTHGCEETKIKKTKAEWKNLTWEICLSPTRLRPNGRYFYLSPYLIQTKQIAWDYAKYYATFDSRLAELIKINESELRIDFPNGSRLQLLGADNPDRLRGLYIDGIILDEYAQIKPNFWNEIIAPALIDRDGYVVFMGTPKGRNDFFHKYNYAQKNHWYVETFRASETNLIPKKELEKLREMMGEDFYDQEMECSWEASIQGAYYANEIKKARKENRLTPLKLEPSAEVYSAWDIGWSDDTSVLIYQIINSEVRIIDAISESGLTISDFTKILQKKNYVTQKDFFPHDAFLIQMKDGKSTVDVAREHGLHPHPTPKLSVQEGIQIGRQIFSHLWIDSSLTNFIEAVTQYRREYDEKKQAFRQNPRHDWASHLADAYRYLAISLPPKNQVQDHNVYQNFLQRNKNRPLNFLPKH